MIGVICLTEQAAGGALEHLRHNVELNRQRLPNAAAVHVVECDWNAFVDSSIPSAATHDIRTTTQAVLDDSSGLKASASVEDIYPAHTGLSREPVDACSEGSPAMATTSSSDPMKCIDLTATKWDFMIGSDLVYNTVGTVMLPRVMRALCSPATQIYYVHTKHRFDHFDLQFFEELTKNGLWFAEVLEPSVHTPPSSPPALTELYPDMRIAVYRIGSQHGPQGRAAGSSCVAVA